MKTEPAQFTTVVRQGLNVMPGDIRCDQRVEVGKVFVKSWLMDEGVRNAYFAAGRNKAQVDGLLKESQTSWDSYDTATKLIAILRVPGMFRAIATHIDQTQGCGLPEAFQVLAGIKEDMEAAVTRMVH